MYCTYCHSQQPANNQPQMEKNAFFIPTRIRHCLLRRIPSGVTGKVQVLEGNDRCGSGFQKRTFFPFIRLIVSWLLAVAKSITFHVFISTSQHWEFVLGAALLWAYPCTVDPRLSEPLWPTATKNSFGYDSQQFPRHVQSFI